MDSNGAAPPGLHEIRRRRTYLQCKFKRCRPPGRRGFECANWKVDMTTLKATAAPVPAKKVPANSNRKLDFKANDHVVYPTHGVGRITRIEEQEVAGIKLELFVITFDKDKMTLRVPTTKAKAVGMRKLSSPDTVATALNTLKGRARIKRTMWSRRAQEYEAKINSGDLVSIAEVVRDLHRASGQPEQSYSERQLYEAALARMAREVAAVEKIDETAAVKRVEGALLKKAA
jgi:CarD family transcriptional regulator